jgi:TonB-dependent starch-binding outer membrane protein SusC
MQKATLVSGRLSRHRQLTKTILRVMQLTAVMILGLCLQVAAHSYGQSITWSAKNASLLQAFTEIEKQTGYVVVGDYSLIEKSKPVTVKAVNKLLKEFIDEIFLGQGFDYTIKNTTISIKEKSTTRGLNHGFQNHYFSDAISPSLTAPPVTGKVVGPNGQPIAGANVVIKGTNRGTTTNTDGSFSIEANKGEIIIISSIGFSERQITVNENMIGVISLDVLQSKLDEVQIIAYGSTSKRLSTGNINGIRANDIQSQPVNNPLLALQGRVPGVFLTQNSGLSGSGITVRIQGQNSIGKGSDPFYVIDGVPYTAQLLPTLNNILGGPSTNNGAGPIGQGNPLSYLNPYDIESIEILKDADATAIYGSRAASGAILITTKKGQNGKTKVNLNFQQGISQISHKVKLLDTRQYLEMRKEAYTNDGNEIPTPATDFKNGSNYDLTVWDQNKNTDWQDELLGGNAKYTDFQVSLMGGSAKTTFRINSGYHKESTVFPGDFSDKKISIGISLNHTSSNQKLKLDFTSNYLVDNNRLPIQDLTIQAMRLPPNAPDLYHPDGSLNWERIASGTDSISTWNNPVAAYKSGYQVNANNLISNLSLSYNLTKALIFKTSFGYTDMRTQEIYTNPLSGVKPEDLIYSIRSGSYSTGNINSWIIEPQLSYGFKISKGEASFLIGSTFHENRNNLHQLSGTGFNSDEAIKNYNSANNLYQISPGIISTYKYNAVFSRLNYNWENKYIVNLSSRRDGSSRYGKNNQFHNFGAVGFAWLFSNENFMRNALSLLSYGKLRGSYGTTGNDQIGDYGFLNQYEVVYSSNNYAGYTGLRPQGHPNPYLQWEETRKLQVGLDLGFIKDHIIIGSTFYRNRSSNQILSYGLSMQTGFGGVLKNFPAIVQNVGWEFTINSTQIQGKHFIWTSNFNISLNRNKLLSFPNLKESPSSNILVIGQPLDVSKYFHFGGVNPETGLYQYYTADGKIVSEPDPSLDKIVVYSNFPKYSGGFQNSFTYRSFNIDFLFQFVKIKAQNFSLGSSYRVGMANYNQPIGVMDRWQKPGDITNIQKFSMSLISTALNSDFIFTDASYIKLRNLALSYSIPSKLFGKINIEDFKIFAQAQNLFTITKYVGPDPESATLQNLPPLRTITFGIKTTL